MDYPKYSVDIAITYDYYEFISIGKKGSILKCIYFYQNEENHLEYYCVMGEVKENGAIDTRSITNNGDMEMVLSTTADAIIFF